MIIWGKVIGALVGLTFYGPAGLVLGLVLGQVFDNGLQNVMTTPSHPVEARRVFFQTVFQTMGFIAKTDGIITENEIKVARDIMLNDFKLTEAQMSLAIQYFNEGKQPDFDLNAMLLQFKTACGKYADLRRYFVELQAKAAMADKILHNAERGRLVFICSSLGIPLSELDYHLHNYGYTFYEQGSTQQKSYSQTYATNDDLSKAYKLIGVSVTDNNKTIKSAYRRLVSKYHPDKLVAKGLPPEMMNVAKEKTQKITVAYDLIMQSRK